MNRSVSYIVHEILGCSLSSSPILNGLVDPCNRKPFVREGLVTSLCKGLWTLFYAWNACLVASTNCLPFGFIRFLSFSGKQNFIKIGVIRTFPRNGDSYWRELCWKRWNCEPTHMRRITSLRWGTYAPHAKGGVQCFPSNISKLGLQGLKGCNDYFSKQILVLGSVVKWWSWEGWKEIT